MIIDAFAFARNAESAHGQLPLADLGRVDLLEREGALAWDLNGFTGTQERLFLRLAIVGNLRLRCQRCLQPMDWPVRLAPTLWLARDETEADALPVTEDAFDAVVGSESLDIDALIEDEVLLALPANPTHDACPHPLSVEKDLAASPFAALAGLKREH